jgi:cytochrome P450
MAAPTRVTTPAGDPAWLVTGHNTVQDLLADTRLGRSHADPDNAARYSDAAIFGRAARATGTPESEQAEHMLMRRLLSRSFSARRLAHLNPRVQELVKALLDGLETMPRPVDLHEALSFPLPTLVICELLGVPYADREDFRRWSDAAADMTDAARSRAGLERLQAYMRRLLDRKRRESAEDVLSDLLAAQELTDGAFTDDKVVDLAVGLLFAGHETTVSAIDRGVVLLLAHPAQLAALKRDPALVASAVEEILRLPDPVKRPPADHATGLARYANTDIELDGTTIAAGDLVLLDLGGANLDPAAFADPERFDITRTPNPHVTFGYGPRFCLGAPLARLELRAVFGALFARFPTLRLAVSVDDLEPRNHLLTGGLAAIPVTW